MQLHVVENIKSLNRKNYISPADIIYDRSQQKIYHSFRTGYDYGISFIVSNNVTLLERIKFNIETKMNYQNIVKNIDKTEIDWLKYNRNIILTESQIKTLKLLKEMI